MTDLRQAAQAAIDAIHAKGYLNSKNKKDLVRIEALRQALVVPVEPVAWQYRVKFRLSDEDGFRHGNWRECRDKAEYYDYKSRHGYEVRELYTAPPSVDALIAEIDGIDRWFYDDGSGPYMCGNKDGGDYYFISDIDDVLDKYRGVK